MQHEANVDETITMSKLSKLKMKIFDSNNKATLRSDNEAQRLILAEYNFLSNMASASRKHLVGMMNSMKQFAHHSKCFHAYATDFFSGGTTKRQNLPSHAPHSSTSNAEELIITHMDIEKNAINEFTQVINQEAISRIDALGQKLGALETDFKYAEETYEQLLHYSKKLVQLRQRRKQMLAQGKHESRDTHMKRIRNEEKFAHASDVYLSTYGELSNNVGQMYDNRFLLFHSLFETATTAEQELLKTFSDKVTRIKLNKLDLEKKRHIKSLPRSVSLPPNIKQLSDSSPYSSQPINEPNFSELLPSSPKSNYNNNNNNNNNNYNNNNNNNNAAAPPIPNRRNQIPPPMPPSRQNLQQKVPSRMPPPIPPNKNNVVQPPPSIPSRRNQPDMLIKDQEDNNNDNNNNQLNYDGEGEGYVNNNVNNNNYYEGEGEGFPVSNQISQKQNRRKPPPPPPPARRF